MENKKKTRRRNYLTKKVFQWKFVGIALLFITLTSGVLVATVYFTGWSLLKEKLSPHYSDQMLSKVFLEMNLLLLLRILFIIPLVIALAILLSHRIAGPLYRIEKSLEKVSQGDFSLRIRLRKNDELKDLAESINKALEYMENREKEISQLKFDVEKE